MTLACAAFSNIGEMRILAIFFPYDPATWPILIGYVADVFPNEIGGFNANILQENRTIRVRRSFC
ncbi:MAG: hypothetical protein PSN37_06150 [Alphaproteobacteria bacterium]|nr:hypothetical protein [Alphaproteobacteria bacterium]